MLKELCHLQQRYLNAYFQNLNLEEAETFLAACLACKGILFFTGIGKSGFIAEKIAATLTSTGTKALFLPPANFLHGDLGVVGPEDIFIMMSKSGETEELLGLIPFARKRGAKVLGILSNTHSRMARACDLSVHLPVEKELCPFDLAPTTSSEVQLLFGDVLAMGLMKAKGFSLKEYSENHPSGSIGKKATLRVEDLMLQDQHLPCCGPQDRLIDRLHELTSKKCGCLLVTSEKREFLGIFTDGDLRRALQNQGPGVLERTMESLMTASAIWVPRNILAHEAVKIMQKDPKKWVMMAPVIDEKKVVGLIRMHDIVQAGVS